MDLNRIEQIASELRELASPEQARFGIYREAHEEDAYARATTDGVVLFVADLLEGLPRIDNPVGNSLIALGEDAPYFDRDSDLRLHAVELFGSDLRQPEQRRLRIAKREYAAIVGCLVVMVLTTVFALAGAFWIGTMVLEYMGIL